MIVSIVMGVLIPKLTSVIFLPLFTFTVMTMVSIFSIDTFAANHGWGGVISPVHIRGAGLPWLSPSRGGELVIISDLLRNLWAMPDLTIQMFKQLSLLFHTFSILIMSRESMHVWDNWIICPQIGWREFLPKHWSQAADKLHKINTNTKHLLKAEMSNF